MAYDPTYFPMPRWTKPQPERTKRYKLDDVPANGNVIPDKPWNKRAVEIAAKREANRRSARHGV